MSINIQQIEIANKRAQQLNAERQKQIGMRESAKSSYDKAVFAYQQKYGVQLDDTNLQAEYNSVSAQTQKEYEELNRLILSIESGEYKKQAESQTINADQAQTETVQTANQVTSNTPPANMVVGSMGAGTRDAEAMAQAIQASLTQQPKPPSFGDFQKPFQQTPTQNTQKEEDISEQAFTPEGWGQPNAINKSFESILGGNNGIKFGQ